MPSSLNPFLLGNCNSLYSLLLSLFLSFPLFLSLSLFLTLIQTNVKAAAERLVEANKELVAQFFANETEAHLKSLRARMRTVKGNQF